MTQGPDGGHRQWVLDVLQQFEGRLLRYAERIAPDADQARDVVQYAFLRLCDEPNGAVANVGPWLYAVCRNRAIDLKRKGKRMQQLHQAADQLYAAADTSPEDAAETKDTCQLVRRILTTLPPAQQEVVDLWAEGLGYKEIAGITDRKEGNVRVMMHRAFKALREHPLAQKVLATTDNEQAPKQTRQVPSPLAGEGSA